MDAAECLEVVPAGHDLVGALGGVPFPDAVARENLADLPGLAPECDRTAHVMKGSRFGMCVGSCLARRGLLVTVDRS
jgi:hypothetical protein